MHIPRILIIDDLFGRTVEGRPNLQRANLCGQFLIKDVTEDEIKFGSSQIIKNPIAEAIFCRGQSPACSTVGMKVENDLDGIMEVIRSGWSDSNGVANWAMILLDLCFYTGMVTEESNRRTVGMPEGNEDQDSNPLTCFGLKILKMIQSEMPDLPVVILSSMPRQEVAQEFTNSGARAFIARDQGNPQTLKNYLNRYGLIPDETGTIIGTSRQLLIALQNARRKAETNEPVLIRGEAGTGKELFASYIHRTSLRKNNLLEVVSLPAIPINLIEDTLFGHVTGAFSGAEGRNAERRGAFEKAHNGTLFLDEIGDTPQEVQPKLLRVIQNGEVQRLGTDNITKVNVRIVSATNIDIESKVAAGAGFRRDLLDRLRLGGTIVLPPLRYRKEDIKLLVERFLEEAQKLNQEALPKQIDPKTLEKLINYDWPGNVRELQRVIFEAVQQFPDVEYLAPVHINISKEIIDSNLGLNLSSSNDEGSENLLKKEDPKDDYQNLKKLIEIIEDFEFDPISLEIVGGLPNLKKAIDQLLARYLETALKVTVQNRSMENPHGEIRIQRAINLMAGNQNDKKITGSEAADMIKKLLNTKEESINTLLENPRYLILKEALEKALILRPKSKK